MIPVSTAIWDPPKWYHNFTGDYNYIFKDKRGILNGIRCLSIIECGKTAQNCKGPDLCQYKPIPACPFLSSYRDNLEQLDFNILLKAFNSLALQYQMYENIKEEIIIVLIVYEAPKNFCSERKTLIDYFISKNVECKELEYPII